ncbi:MAG: hypothetical protein LBP52_06090 [Burkholderiaceae bacterium]|jgi:hypothetical protein|nr:hypothetical protein [Burkholderiaceae bacterium]
MAEYEEGDDLFYFYLTALPHDMALCWVQDGGGRATQCTARMAGLPIVCPSRKNEQVAMDLPPPGAALCLAGQAQEECGTSPNP